LDFEGFDGNKLLLEVVEDDSIVQDLRLKTEDVGMDETNKPRSKHSIICFESCRSPTLFASPNLRLKLHLHEQTSRRLSHCSLPLFFCVSHAGENGLACALCHRIVALVLLVLMFGTIDAGWPQQRKWLCGINRIFRVFLDDAAGMILAVDGIAPLDVHQIRSNCSLGW
jgi:hypothetical protein